jgi:WD40 repeat protein
VIPNASGKLNHLETGQTLTPLQGHAYTVNAVAITPDGRRALSGSDDSTLRVWDLRDGKKLVILTVDRNVTVCAVAHDNRTIVAGDYFGRVHFLRLVAASQ